MKILIVDDHPIVLKGLSTILQSYNNTISICEASTGKQAYDFLKKDKFEVVILDLSLPDTNGISVLTNIKEKYPDTKVIIQSVMSEDVYERKCFEAGASAYLKKESACDDLIAALTSVLNNKTYFSDKLMSGSSGSKTGVNIHEMLSTQEFQVLMYAGKGLKNKEISDKMNVSEKTISTYKSRILIKLNIKSNDLLRFCIDSGIVN